MRDEDLPRTLVRTPAREPRSAARTALHAVAGLLLVAPYWLAAALRGVPGLRLRAKGLTFGLRALLAPGRLSLHAIFHLLCMPMESTRYFEFGFTDKALAGLRPRRYLDVSSPRLMPVTLIDERPDMQALLVNPNPRDLAETAAFVALTGAGDRTRLESRLVTELPLDAAGFDLITCLSVLEHIPDDFGAVRHLWALLAPGGTLVLTMPCMARASRQMIDQDEWGLLDKDENGHVFWQRFYDRALLESRVFCTTGAPLSEEIYGEKKAGAMVQNSEHKRADPSYPYWKEPWMMAVGYTNFARLEDLPGEGVIGLVFRKPA